MKAGPTGTMDDGGQAVQVIYFSQAEKRGLRFDGLTPNELVAQRLSYVEATRKKYQEFWAANVKPQTTVPGEAADA